MDMTAQQKGNLLEAAVLAIEQLILQTAPNVKEKSFVIQNKKIVTVVGVRHEIDLFVSFDLGPGYNSIFIFECKNWQEAVGKNEIIVFAEKIVAVGAQRGFFVAKSFTADAMAQAKKEPRMELLLASEHAPAMTILPFGFHYTFNTPRKIGARANRRGGDRSKFKPLDITGIMARLDGTDIAMRSLLDQWTIETINESMRTFPSGLMEDGIYERSCQSARTFRENQLLIEENDIESVELEIDFQVHIRRPAVISHFEVGGRGRVITLEGFTSGEATIHEVQFIFGQA